MLHVHRAERADALVEALRELLAAPAGDPFAPEVVAVPTRGMERWLTQRLSLRLGTSEGRTDGVCANVEWPTPRRLAADAVAVAAGLDPDADPWLPERAVWPLLDVVDAALEEPWLSGLAGYLQGSPARRFTSVRHLAALFDRYALHRPELVRAWAAGRGSGWQPELWRRLRARIGEPGPAERREAACARLREAPDLLDLPPRLSLFGLTRLPAGLLEVLDALAAGRDVHLLLLHPSPALWEKVAAAGPVVRRNDDPTAELPANRLLASWGQDSREMQLVLAPHPFTDHPHPGVRSPHPTLLARLQDDVRCDRMPPGAPLPGVEEQRPLLAAGDRSLQVHACHGRARQVEVLRDSVLHLLAADESLEPRDVIVMCPDIETFAPLIGATFGAGEVFADEDGEDDDGALPAGVRPPDLRVRLADRSLRQTNPVLGVVGRLLDLVAERLTASQVLDLADREPVRRRFRLDDDDLARMEDWVADGGIRWGLDARHRAPFKLDALDAGTWRAGLDRLLLGVTMTEEDERLFGNVLPLDDVDSGAIDLAGRFAELIDRLGRALDALSRPQAIGEWAAALAEAADALTATGPRDAWQRAELQRVLGDVVAEATVGGTVHAAELTPEEVRALLAQRLEGRPTRANFRTGHLTICTLMPMRSVPHRVVCLLGLDDGVFPRRAPRDGDDLTLDDPHVGDRDPRTEDRQMLLDALMAAGEKLIVTYTGADERTNAERPPAVPVGELLDAVDRTVRTADGRRARDQVTVRHPLQPFDPRNFDPGVLAGDGPWSFDRVTLDGAAALGRERPPAAPFLRGPLPPAGRALVELDDLVRFVQHPCKAFLRQRLGISVADHDDEVADDLAIELDGLERWGVGQRLLDAGLAGVDRRAACLAEMARGTLPPGQLGLPVITELEPLVADLLDAVREAAGDGEPVSLDVRVALAGGRTLTGTVAGVVGDALRTATFSRVSAKHRLTAWVRLLALAAAHPGRSFEAVTAGRAGDRDARLTVARIAPVEAGEARAQLETLADLHARGLREPLPLACQTSAAYAQAAAAGADPIAAAREAWESGWSFPREDADLEHQLVRGGIVTLEALLDEPPAADEHGPGWDAAEPTRFGRYARRLWAGLLEHETVEQR